MSRPRSRREFIKDTGVLIIGFSFSTNRTLGAVRSVVAPAAPAAAQLDSWLVVGADGSITAFSGKVELGTGVSTARAQTFAAALAPPFGRITWGQGDRHRRCDQGTPV